MTRQRPRGLRPRCGKTRVQTAWVTALMPDSYNLSDWRHWSPRIQGVIEHVLLRSDVSAVHPAGSGLSLWASFRTKSAFRTYSKVPCARQFTGAQAARLMLDRAGLHRVGIGRSHGLLSDHYNPATRSLYRTRFPGHTFVLCRLA